MHPLALLMIDADGFKLYNDARGHQAGDQLLQAISRCIAGGTRLSDFTARYGGEEFAVLLPELGGRMAFKVAERIRARFVDLGLKHPSSPIGFATVSIGLSCIAPTAGTDVRDLITAADRALYRAKRLGRHRTELAGAEGELAASAAGEPTRLRLVS
jgi:diguanylate cyclase (GGDEF)-like protein